MAKKILIVGAGPGGLTAGMILAHRGFDVHIYEKEDRVGGRNAELTVGEHSFDLGPTFLMMKFILDEMFAETGRKSEDYLTFTKLDPLYRLNFKDKQIDITQNRQEMIRQIKEYFPGDEVGYDKFMKREAKRFETIFACLQKDYSHLHDYLNPVFLKAIPEIPLGKTLIQYLGKYFKSEELRIAFTFQSKYLGMSPWSCPAFFVILAYIEHAFGIYHVEGGLCKIADAMAKVVQEEGGSIHLNSPVKQLLVNQKVVKGVELSSGEKVYADDVIVNADFAYAMTELLPEGATKKYTKTKLDQKDYSCSTFMLYLGLDTVYEDIEHHTIIFADDYKSNLKDISSGTKLSDDMSIYVRNSVVSDKTTSPQGKSGLYVLVPVANTTAGIDWDKEKHTYREKVLKRICERLNIPDLQNHIEAETMITPADWQQAHIYNGAVFNLAHSLDQMLYARPHNEFQELNNMYLVGGGTHPGSGLPTIYESGRISSNMVSKKHGVEFSQPRPFSQKNINQ